MQFVYMRCLVRAITLILFSSSCRIREELDPNFNPGLHEDLYAFWSAGVVGLILHILALLHAVLWGKASYIIGSIVSTLYA